MVQIAFIPVGEFRRVRAADVPLYDKWALIADMCRTNALATVKRAGSGHLGSSFSSLDIVTLLYYAEMNTGELGPRHPDRDVYFSSKGHDAPGLYAALYSLGILPEEQFLRLRRLGGTLGHPDVSIRGIEANTGSLGMGISKAKGIAVGKKLLGRGGRVFVMTGDGELQEGQIYEALQTAAHQGIVNLNIIVDHNKLQSDKPVREICDLGDLDVKFRAFGWHVERCDGHNFRELEGAFRRFRFVDDRPKILIADTIKGKGVSFMEHPAALKASQGIYRWHAGAPDDESFTDAWSELVRGINKRLESFGLAAANLKEMPSEAAPQSAVTQEYVAEAFGAELAELASERNDLVVLDGDLAADCRIRGVEALHPERFIENGIAEQDMVSMAGGLALQGLLPVVNSFANFLAARANEQIYNNGCERTKIIYACHYSGLIPAGPGASHQSIRDISLFGSLPNFLLIEPCNAAETRAALRYAVLEAAESCALRLVIGPSPRLLPLPPGYEFTPGRGAVLAEGESALLFAYGPVMLHEALLASEALKKEGFHLKVVNMPWLNRFDVGWLKEVIGGCAGIYVLDDHSPIGGLGDQLGSALLSAGLLAGKRFEKFGVEGYPACGTPREALEYHGLDGAALAARLRAREKAGQVGR